MNSREDKNTHVVIVGAGYAGVLAANRAAAKGHQVTLVNDRDSFVDRIRLHEVIAGIRTSEAAQIPLEKAVRPRVRLVIAPAARIRSRTVELATGETVRGDHIVVATGSGAGPDGLEWAEKNHAAVAGLPPGASVAVAGAGLTGGEVASEIAYARPDLRRTLADPIPVGTSFSDSGRRHLPPALERLGVRIASQTSDDTDLVVDCTGFATPPLAGAR
ncbi:MAG: FAD-dependent oxidoreductase [Actinobacteria bacterium]|nr:FAD-dependent oxidoreductase [Actinomycetota bacterium]